MAKSIVYFTIVFLCDIASAAVETHSLDTLPCPGRIDRRGTPELNVFKSHLNTALKKAWRDYTSLLAKSKTYEHYQNLSEDVDINPFLQKTPKSKRLEYCLIASVRYLEWIRETELSLLNRTKLLVQDFTSGKDSFRRSFDALCTIGRLAETVSKSPDTAKVSLNISDINSDIGPNLVKVLTVKDSISSFVKCLINKSRRLKGVRLSTGALTKLGKCKWGKHRCSWRRTKKKNRGKTRKSRKTKKRIGAKRRKSTTNRRKKTKGGSRKYKKNIIGRPQKDKKKRRNKVSRTRNRKRNDGKH